MVERLCDIGTMVSQWEEMEGNVLEWKVEEGERRGGRKVRWRISELLWKFEGGGGSCSWEGPRTIVRKKYYGGQN